MRKVSALLLVLPLFCIAQVAVKPPTVPPRLLSDLKSRDADTRRRAADDLGSLRAKVAVRPLISVLSDKDASAREAAAFALGQITEPRAVDALIKRLSDKDLEVRASAAFAIGMLDDRKATKALSDALNDDEPAVRSCAVAGLGLMQDEESLDEIVEMLNDASFDVRYDAVWALGQIGEPEAAAHLRASLINLDLIRLEQELKEAFRQAVQMSLDSLRTGGDAEPSRPRRVSPDAERPRLDETTTRPAAVRQSVRAAPTERALRAGRKGAVELKILVGAEGRGVRAYVVRRLGLGLDQRAVEAALMYRFDPAMLKGLPQTEWMRLEVRF